MEKKVNLAELLKNCPHGMELDCTMYDNLYFKCVRGHAIYPIVCYTVDSKGEKHETSFNWYGKHTPIDTAKCAIFPKGKTTWEGFVPPCKFKDGDVLTYMFYNKPTIYIYRENGSCNTSYYAGYSFYNERFYKTANGGLCGDRADLRFATEEEKQKLFKAIKDNGYRWNAETKTLEELPKFKDGDILYCDANDCGENDDKFKYIFIFDKLENGKYYYSHCHLGGSEFYDGKTFLVNNNYPVRFATEEEKEKLFKAISDEGYKWDPDTKTLFTVPIFKAGDRIKRKDSPAVHAIKIVEKDLYIFDDLRSIPICVQGDYELVPKKFDVNTLKPFDRVLVRTKSFHDYWISGFFSHKDSYGFTPFWTTADKNYQQCIPYEGNEHLLGTANDCDEYYKI